MKVYQSLGFQINVFDQLGLNITSLVRKSVKYTRITTTSKTKTDKAYCMGLEKLSNEKQRKKTKMT